MTSAILRILVDFGLLVLIWVVQLVVYPSFLHYPKEQLKVWHKKYTLRISFIVIPLIFGQLFLALLQLWKIQSLYTIGSLVLIGMAWLSTFTQFAPVHAKMHTTEYRPEMLTQLVKRNWLRTFLWTLIFIWSFIEFRTT